MKQDITQYINKYQTCQKIKSSKTHHQYTTSSTAGEAPFTRVAMNYFGALSKSTEGNTKILVVLGTLTKYVEIYPIKSTTAGELAATL